MRMRFGRRTATLAAAAALSAGALLTTAGTASADDIVPLTTSHWVGLYNYPNTTGGKIGWGDVPPGGAVYAQCWTVGESIGNYGNTWYRVNQVNYGNGWYWTGNAYVFAGYADGNAHSVNRDPNIPQCRS
ncbi:hypothetical protein ACWDBD_42765 [Streptomyces sp. NPDC001118]